MRLGQSCENLPQGVRLSPAQQDSSITAEARITAEALGDISEAEAGRPRETTAKWLKWLKWWTRRWRETENWAANWLMKWIHQFRWVKVRLCRFKWNESTTFLAPMAHWCRWRILPVDCENVEQKPRLKLKLNKKGAFRIWSVWKWILKDTQRTLKDWKQYECDMMDVGTDHQPNPIVAWHLKTLGKTPFPARVWKISFPDKNCLSYLQTHPCQSMTVAKLLGDTTGLLLSCMVMIRECFPPSMCDSYDGVCLLFSIWAIWK